MRRRPIDYEVESFSNATDWLLGEGRHFAKKFEIVRGVIEYNRDPQHRGRVMVRILEDGPEHKLKHKDQIRVGTFELGWCEPLFGYGSGSGFGSFVVPPVGSRVFVMFERGVPENRLYFGGWVANPPKQRRYGVTDSTLHPEEIKYEWEEGYVGEDGKKYKHPPKPTEYQGHWLEEQGPELPIEIRSMIDQTPDTNLFFKTVKGAALIAKERDQEEYLALIDRLGAELRFESNTVLVENGVNKRGRKSASQTELVDSSSILDHSTHNVFLLNANKSGLENSANLSGDDYVTLRSNTKDDVFRNPDLFSDQAVLELDRGENRIRLAYIDGGEISGVIEVDIIKKTISIQGLNDVSISSSENIILDATNIKIKGNLEVEGDITQRGENRMTLLDNDTTPHGSPIRNMWHRDNDTYAFNYPYDRTFMDRNLESSSLAIRKNKKNLLDRG